MSDRKGQGKAISIDEARSMLQPLIGMALSRPWPVVGSAMFCEFGALHEDCWSNKKGERRVRLVGEATLCIAWSWRVEKPRSIWFGSFNSTKVFRSRLLKLEGLHIRDIGFQGRLREIAVALDGDVWIHSFSTVSGQPQWHLWLPNRGRLTSKMGHLRYKAPESPTGAKAVK